MAKANVLSARTIDYLELIGNGRRYRVPPYQRDYRWEETAYRLGNLTLLERTANRTIGNAAYADKAAAYARSRYALSRQIPEDASEQWTPALLDARQNRMAARAAHLWRSDFP